MLNGFTLELDAIKTLRQHFPKMGQRTLANRIKQGLLGGFDGTEALAAKVAERPWYSVYAAIRRLDKAMKNNTALATAGA